MRQDLFVIDCAFKSSILLLDEATNLCTGRSRLESTPRFAFSFSVCGATVRVADQRAGMVGLVCEQTNFLRELLWR